MLYTCLSLFYNVFHLKNFPTNGYITTPQTVTLRFVSHCFSTICKPLTIEKTLKDNIKKRCFSFFLTYTFIGGYNGA